MISFYVTKKQDKKLLRFVVKVKFSNIVSFLTIYLIKVSPVNKLKKKKHLCDHCNVYRGEIMLEVPIVISRASKTAIR